MVRLSGEAGIGKSRLVEVSREQVAAEPQAWLMTADYAPLTMSPERQKQQTLHALLMILLHIAAQQPVLFVMEDLARRLSSDMTTPVAYACDIAATSSYKVD